MKRDHTVVHALIKKLAWLTAEFKAGSTPGNENALRRVLYGLYTLVGVCFAKEEEITLPLQDAGLTPDEAVEMFERLEEAAVETHRAVHV